MLPRIVLQALVFDASEIGWTITTGTPASVVTALFAQTIGSADITDEEIWSELCLDITSPAWGTATATAAGHTHPRECVALMATNAITHLLAWGESLVHAPGRTGIRTAKYRHKRFRWVLALGDATTADSLALLVVALQLGRADSATPATSIVAALLGIAVIVQATGQTWDALEGHRIADVPLWTVAARGTPHSGRATLHSLARTEVVSAEKPLPAMLAIGADAAGMLTWAFVPSALFE